MVRKLCGSNKSNLSIITKRTLIISMIFILFFTISSLVFSISPRITVISPQATLHNNPQSFRRGHYQVPEADMLKWKFETGGDIFSSPVVGSNGTVYIGSADHFLYAINPNGTLKWKFETVDTVKSSPATGIDGTVYIGSADHFLYAINPNGTLKWKFETGGDIFSSPVVGSNGTVYIGSADHFLYAINPNGTLKWKFETGGDIFSSPTLGSDGTVYIGSTDFYLYVINPNGTLKWKIGTIRIEGYSSPTLGSDGTIYIGSGVGYLYAFDPNSILKWKFETEIPIKSSPAIGSDGTIMVGNGDYIFAINQNGTLKWKFKTEGAILSSPVMDSDGLIYVGSLDGNLYAINPNGTLKWLLKINRIKSSPAIGSDGTIYVGLLDGNLYAVGGSASPPPISETAYFLTGSLHCLEKGGYPCDSCSSESGYLNHFKGFNILTSSEDCYISLTYNDGEYIGDQDSEVTITGEKWAGLEDESETELVEEINSGRFDFQSANKFIVRKMNIPGDNYKYEFANEGKEFRLYLSRNREEALKAVPWQNMVIEIKNIKTNKVFKYKFEKGIFPLAYSWSDGGVANYGQSVWWAAKRWVEEVDPVTLFPFYPPSPLEVNVEKIDADYQPKNHDILINYDPNNTTKLGHYGFVEKAEGNQVTITQFNWIKPGEIYNYIIRIWNGEATSLFYSNNFYDQYYFKYYYRR